ncbi:MAG TPA: NUDIX domain-containing protein [Kineosporiaceae bacterium]|nr:NUDIX domain-containing protein [Kineosporiaceae bacterium]
MNPTPTPTPAPAGPDDGDAGTPRIPCVGAVVHDEQGRILLVRRVNPPGAGLWSIPGGKVEPGEDDATAVVREVAEETGLLVRAGEVLGQVERPAPGGGIFVITDLRCRAVGGRLAYGDDAADAGWFGAAELAATATVPGLVEALAEWQVLPR